MAGDTTTNCSMPDVLILGAGITGVATAYLLAREGLEVRVIDRGAAPALETTYANGGQISVSHAEPWAHPGAPEQVLKWLAQKESPLYFSPRLDWRQWAWLVSWLWQCRKPAADRNTLQIMKIALRSRELYRQVREAEKIDYAQKSLGILHFYRNPAEFENARRVAALMTENGCRRRPVTKEEIDAIEPALARNRDIVGGTYTEEDESGDARRFTQALAGICEQKYGVRFLFGANVERLVSSAREIRQARVTAADGAEGRPDDPAERCPHVFEPSASGAHRPAARLVRGRPVFLSRACPKRSGGADHCLGSHFRGHRRGDCPVRPLGHLPGARQRGIHPDGAHQPSHRGTD